MSSENKTTTRGGISLTALALLWGMVTQALTWAGVISWPWYAIWGPALIAAGITVIVLLVIFVLALLMVAADR